MCGVFSLQVNLDYQDKLEQEKGDARNAVEEYVYSMRDKLCNLTEFVTDADREVFSQMLTSTEDWLYDEGEDQPKKVYVEHLTALRKCGDPILLREKEYQERPSAFNALGKMVIHYEKILNSFSQGVSAFLCCDLSEKCADIYCPHTP